MCARARARVCACVCLCVRVGHVETRHTYTHTHIPRARAHTRTHTCAHAQEWNLLEEGLAKELQTGSQGWQQCEVLRSSDTGGMHPRAAAGQRYHLREKTTQRRARPRARDGQDLLLAGATQYAAIFEPGGRSRGGRPARGTTCRAARRCGWGRSPSSPMSSRATELVDILKVTSFFFT